jgi:hypothetical protein
MLNGFYKIKPAFLVIVPAIMLSVCGTSLPAAPAPDAPVEKNNGFPVFDINNLPPVETWNRNGEIYAYPDPFLMANGTRISSPMEWETRRKEISKIVQHYYEGYYPPPPDAVNISGPGATGPGDLTVTITGNGGKTADFTFPSLFIPDTAPNGLPPSVTNKIPLVICIGAQTPVYRAQGYATIDFSANSDSLSGPAQDIWQYSTDDPDAPSALMREAWKAGRLIDAIELGAGGGIIDPRKILVTGMSRRGKDSLVVGAFAESMSGTRIAVTCPVSSGSGGVAPERWTSFKRDTGNTYGAPRPRDIAGYNDYTLMFLDTGTPDGTPLAVKVYPPDHPDWKGVQGADRRGANDGLQTNAECRLEVSAWYGPRIFDYAELHKDWAINNLNDASSWGYGDGHDGILPTYPLDSHFLMALCAGSNVTKTDGQKTAIIIFDGYKSSNGRTAPEPQYVMYLAVQEVFDFLGIPNYNGVRLYDIDHSQPVREQYDLVDFANNYFNEEYGTGYKRLSADGYPVTAIEGFTDKLKDLTGNDTDSEGYKLKICTWFNPYLREDYYRLNWASPNKPAGSSVAEQVRDYFKKHPNMLRDSNGNWITIDYKEARDFEAAAGIVPLKPEL